MKLSHAERRERRRLIANHVSEHGLVSASKEFKASLSLVRVAAKEFGVKIPSLDRMARINSVAKYAAEHGVSSACLKFGVSVSHVYTSLRETGIDLPDLPPKYRNKVCRYRVLKLILDGRSYSDIARELGVSRQRISQYAQMAEKAGFELPYKESDSK